MPLPTPLRHAEPDAPRPSRRRDVLRSAVVLGTGLVLAHLSRGATAQVKIAKSAVQYTDQGYAKGKDCDDCALFVPGRTIQDLGTCKVVEGAINPHGHCIAFSPRA